MINRVPAWLRRLFTIPAVLAGTVLLFSLLPLWAVVGAFMSPWLPGRWRPMRFLWFGVVYAALENAVLLALLWLWLDRLARRLLGRFDERQWQDAHYAVIAWFLSRVRRTAVRVFRLQVDVDEPMPPPAAVRVGPRRPLLVCCRHAGPGDSFLLIHALMVAFRRRPRIVLKDMLRLDPAVDVGLGRLPNRFITPRPQAGEDVDVAIAELAATMAADDALVIFPEGGNFTERRRLRAIERLRSKGHHDEAAKAERMRNVLPPRPGGLLAAIEAAPGADVVFVAHEGLEDLSSVFDLWRGLPMDDIVEARWWRVPAEDVPEAREEQIDWLFAWWERMDRWIADRRPLHGRGPGALASRPGRP
jgi:1-acyl-sn-glycerol-3-phosphate acyltransferase